MGSHLTWQPPYEKALHETAKALSHIGVQQRTMVTDDHRQVASISFGANRNGLNGFRPTIDKFWRYKPFALTIPNYLEFIADINKAMKTILICCHRSPQSKRFSAIMCHFILKRTNNYVFNPMLTEWPSADSVHRSVEHDLDRVEPLLRELMVDFTKAKFIKLMMVI